MSTPAVPGPVPISGEVTESAQRAKPTKTIPTDRISVPKQLDILRAYAAASANGTRPATVGEVAEIVKMASTTIQIAHAFLSSVNLITRTGTGAYTVSTDAINFLKAFEWDKETASHKLGPAFRNAWFGQALMSRITFGPIEEKVAIGVLAEASGAGPEYEKELKMLVEFMAAGGLVVREGGQVRPRPVLAEASTPPPASTMNLPQPRHEPAEPAANASRLNTSVNATPGKFNLNISVEVDMAEFATWRPERIQAFFRGVAEVLAAKADVEKGGAGS